MIRRPEAEDPSQEASEKRWRDYLAWVDRHIDGSWVFRGLGDRDFTLTPTIGRPVGRHQPYTPAREQQVLQAFKNRAPMFIQSPRSLTPWDWLTLAQHYGVPTRLLDWTYNPLVAAFFAVTSGPSHRPCKIVAVRLSAAEFVRDDDLDPFKLDGTRFFEGAAVAPRVAAQSGLFSVHARPTEDWAPDTGSIKSFGLTAVRRALIQEKLAGLGINAGSIWGDLGGWGQCLRWQFESGRPFPGSAGSTLIELPPPPAANDAAAARPPRKRKR